MVLKPGVRAYMSLQTVYEAELSSRAEAQLYLGISFRTHIGAFQMNFGDAMTRTHRALGSIGDDKLAFALPGGPPFSDNLIHPLSADVTPLRTKHSDS